MALCWQVSGVSATIARVSSSTTRAQSSAQDCNFCATVAGHAEASIVYKDGVVVVFMDLNPVTPGTYSSFPGTTQSGWKDLDEAMSLRVWAVGHPTALALRRSGLRCEGINIFLADGEVALQEELHFLLHVFPRYAEDGFTIGPHWAPRS